MTTHLIGILYYICDTLNIGNIFSNLVYYFIAICVILSSKKDIHYKSRIIMLLNDVVEEENNCLDLCVIWTFLTFF